MNAQASCFSLAVNELGQILCRIRIALDRRGARFALADLAR